MSKKAAALTHSVGHPSGSLHATASAEAVGGSGAGDDTEASVAASLGRVARATCRKGSG